MFLFTFKSYIEADILFQQQIIALLEVTLEKLCRLLTLRAYMSNRKKNYIQIRRRATTLKKREGGDKNKNKQPKQICWQDFEYVFASKTIRFHKTMVDEKQRRKNRKKKQASVISYI